MSDQVVKLRDAQGKQGDEQAAPDNAAHDMSESEARAEQNAMMQAGADDRPDTHDTRHEAFDNAAQVWLSRFTHGLSPAALMNAWFDWATHMVAAPGKQLGITEKAGEKFGRYMRYAMECAGSTDAVAPCIDPLPQDNRFRGDAWQMPPFNLIQQGFLLQQQWWHNIVTGVPGVTAQHECELQFLTRQALDVFAPSNFHGTNPEVLKKTQQTGGLNLIRGFQNYVEDLQDVMAGEAPEGADSFLPGRDVAVTKGSVVYRNQLIELIQYAPLTDKVRPEPILIVPAWIMKYYILDLSPQNSLVRYLIEQGHTVFMISWKNPDAGDRDMTLDDYRRLGVMEALDAVSAIVPDQKVHAVGYCLGGTLLSISAAAMARDYDARLASLSLLASQIDFTEPGELVPWRSAFKIDMLSDTDVTFALTSGGHNVGIVSEPDHPRRTYRVRHRNAEALHVDPDTWLNETPERDGSWSPAWSEWLAARSGDMTSPPPMGRKDHPPLGDAPGTYVFQK